MRSSQQEKKEQHIPETVYRHDCNSSEKWKCKGKERISAVALCAECEAFEGTGAFSGKNVGCITGELGFSPYVLLVGVGEGQGHCLSWDHNVMLQSSAPHPHPIAKAL